MLPEFLQELKKRGFRLVHVVPGEGETPVVAAGADWTSTTEPIIARTLNGAGGKKPPASAGKPKHAPQDAQPARGKADDFGAAADGGGASRDGTTGGNER
jgi:hypothetical protein